MTNGILAAYRHCPVMGCLCFVFKGEVLGCRTRQVTAECFVIKPWWLED
ncbi:MAG: hypothetical protein HQK55_06660 [Deltaproteobacteria bacterium]|nr:hypothetical protein [Deltaproteobacteria bacterium]